MKKILEKIDIRSFVAGIIIGLFLGLAVFSALVPSGLDMAKLYFPEKFKDTRKNMQNVELNIDKGGR